MIKDDEFDVVIKNSGVEIAEGEQIKRSYQPFLIQLSEIHAQSQKINWQNPVDVDESIARQLRLKTVKIRTDSEKLKDQRKRSYLLRGNLEQACYNLIAASCRVAEDDFTKVEKAREIAEAKRRKELHDVRLTELQQYGFVYDAGFHLDVMDETMYQSLLLGLKKAQEDRIAEEKRAEEERIAAAKKAEEERLAMIAENERLRKEAEKKEKEMAAERARVEAERKAADEKARKEREAAAKKLAEERRISAEKLAKEQAEARRLADELQAKKDAEEAERKRKESEENARIAAEKKAAAAPDKEKLRKMVQSAVLPEAGVTTDAGYAIEKQIHDKFQAFKNWADTLIDTL